MIILLGKNASGKTTLREELEKLGGKSLVSYTTREPREGEVDGRDYHFVSRAYFEKLIEDGKFFEYGRNPKCDYYGTLRADYDDDKIAIIGAGESLNKVLNLDTINAEIFFLKCSTHLRLDRMLRRNEELKSIYNRIYYENFRYHDTLSHVSLDSENYNPKELAHIMMEKKGLDVRQQRLGYDVEELKEQIDYNNFDSTASLFFTIQEYIVRKSVQERRPDNTNTYFNELKNMCLEKGVEYDGSQEIKLDNCVYSLGYETHERL